MFIRTMILLVVAIAISVFSWGTNLAIVPTFFGWISEAAPLMLLSIAAGVLISCGQIDISSGSLFSLYGMLILWDSNYLGDTGILYSAIASFIIIVMIYAFMGLTVIKGGVSSLLCSLGFSFGAKSISIFINGIIFSWNGTHIVALDHLYFFRYGWIYAAILIIILSIWRYNTYSGLQHVAVGMDATASEIAGVSVSSVGYRAFLASGGLVALSSVLFLSGPQGGGWSIDTGWGRELLAIAAAVIGGSRISGGSFDPFCIALASFLLVETQWTLVNFHLWPEFTYLAFGIALILSGWSGRRLFLLEASLFPRSRRGTK